MVSLMSHLGQATVFKYSNTHQDATLKVFFVDVVKVHQLILNKEMILGVPGWAWSN